MSRCDLLMLNLNCSVSTFWVKCTKLEVDVDFPEKSKATELCYGFEGTEKMNLYLHTKTLIIIVHKPTVKSNVCVMGRPWHV